MRSSTGERKLRIMVVDDDMDQMAMWELCGDIPDTIIAIKKGGISALEFLNDFNYDVDAVVMDLSMPDMDGITLTRQIRSNEDIRGRRNSIKIFWYTGFPVGQTIRTAREKYKVEEIFTKPAFPPEVVQKVRERLNAQGSQQ